MYLITYIYQRRRMNIDFILWVNLVLLLMILLLGCL